MDHQQERKQPHPLRPTEDQRKALEESEKNASREHPQTFKDESTDEKIVEIGSDLKKDPIKGIDPEESGKPER